MPFPPTWSGATAADPLTLGAWRLALCAGPRGAAWPCWPGRWGPLAACCCCWCAACALRCPVAGGPADSLVGAAALPVLLPGCCRGQRWRRLGWLAWASPWPCTSRCWRPTGLPTGAHGGDLLLARHKGCAAGPDQPSRRWPQLLQPPAVGHRLGSAARPGIAPARFQWRATSTPAGSNKPLGPGPGFLFMPISAIIILRLHRHYAKNIGILKKSE